MAAISVVLDFLKPLVEDGVNRALRADPDMAARLAPLAGRVCRIELADLGITFDAAPDATGLRLGPAGSQAPDVTLRGSLLAIARLATGNGRLPASSRAEIAGDAELAHAFARALREFDPDWEEELSRYIGDVAAHLIGKTFRAARAWTADARTRVRADVSEYLREEARLLPDHAAVAAFIAEVDRLRADADRLAARVENLLRSKGP